MFRWIPYTFVRTVLFFIGGILLGLYAPDSIGEGWSLVLGVTLAAIYFVLVFSRLRKFLNPGLIALPLVFLIGYLHLIRQTESRDPDHLLYTGKPITCYKAIITRFAEEKARTWKIEAQVEAVHTGTWETRKGKVILYFPKSDFPHPFDYGEVLIIQGYPQEVQKPGNPGEFNYKQFLSFKNIYHQHFIRQADDVVRIGFDPPHYLMAYSLRGREWAESTLSRFINGKQEQAIAAALVLGVTDGLDSELLNAYASTGSMHVLAVSGLHVSIIYFIILWMFKPINRLPGGSWVVAVVSLCMLWIYAFVTGLPPSVLRAVTMFSFLAIAKPWAKSTNVYNTLAVSAFFILWFDPYMIRSVGFQLSYMAVLGIVYLYPRLLRLWEPRHWLTTEVWKLTCVSVAAQTATFSLGLLYFHQFPNYFLLSNLIVVPLSFAILLLGLLVLAVSFMPVVAGLVGYCLEWVIRFVNGIVFTLESFPFSLIDGVYVSAFQCGLLMALVLVFILLSEFRKFKYLLFASLIILIFAAGQWLHFSREVNIQKFIVYKIPGHSAMDFIDRGQTFFLTDSILRRDRQKINFHVDPNRLVAGVRTVKADFPYSRSLNGGNLIFWQGKVILQITEPDFEVPAQLPIDWLIISNNAVHEVETVAMTMHPKKVVLDSSNAYFFATHFLEKAKLYKLDVYSVLHEGAFTLKIANRNS